VNCFVLNNVAAVV